MKSTYKKLTIHLQNFGYPNISRKKQQLRNTVYDQKTLDMLTYQTLGIAKPTIRLPISYPIKSQHIWYFLLYKNQCFSSLVPTIDIMQIFVVKRQTNMK